MFIFPSKDKWYLRGNGARMSRREPAPDQRDAERRVPKRVQTLLYYHLRNAYLRDLSHNSKQQRDNGDSISIARSSSSRASIFPRSLEESNQCARRASYAVEWPQVCPTVVKRSFWSRSKGKRVKCDKVLVQSDKPFEFTLGPKRASSLCSSSLECPLR